MAERDAVLVHVHGRDVTFAVWLDLHFQRSPGLAVVTALIDGENRGRMVLLDEGQNFSVGLVHGHAAPHESFADDDFIAPGLTTVLTAPQLHAVEKRQHSSVGRHDNVGEPVPPMYLLNFELRFAEKRRQLAFKASFLGTKQ